MGVSILKEDVFFYVPKEKIEERLTQILNNSVSVDSGSGSYSGFDVMIAMIDERMCVVEPGCTHLYCVAIISQSEKLKDPNFKLNHWYFKMVPGKQVLKAIGAAIYDSINI